jgi:hypothetical protein
MWQSKVLPPDTYFRTNGKQGLLKVSIRDLKPNSSLEANNEYDTNHS